jgi:hypothetical protein
MESAIVLICHTPKEDQLDFFNNFVNYKIYVIIDDNSKSYEYLTQKYKNIAFIQVENMILYETGFIHANLRGNSDTRGFGWDKALFCLSTMEKEFKYVWFLEDDVFFYDETTLQNLDTKYEKEDLLCNSSFEEGKLYEWVWNSININFNPPYYCGMMCICRFTKKMLNSVKKYANDNKTLFFIEAMLPTLAKKNDLIVYKSPEEFSTVTYNTKWNISDLNKNCLYHPMKDTSQYLQLRNNLDCIH